MDSAMDQTILRHEVQEIGFGFYTDTEVRQLSVKQITSRMSFDTLNNPVIGGLYDPAMGPIDYHEICQTCHQTQKECPGHLGHIELAVPVYNPVLFGQMMNILKRKCFLCHKFRMASARSRIIRVQLLLLDNHYYKEAVLLSELLEQRNGIEDEPPARTHARQQGLLDEYERLALSGINNDTSERKILPRSIEVQRNGIISEFLKNVKAKCENCGGISPALRQDNNAKIFLKPLSHRSIKINRSKNLVTGSALDVVMGNVSKDDDVKMNGNDSESSFEEDSDMEENDKQDNRSIHSMSKSTYLPPLEVQSQLQMMWQTEDGLMELLYGDRYVASSLTTSTKKNEGWKKFFITVVPVAPSRFRPPMFLGDQQFEHAQNTNLSKIITLSESIGQGDRLQQKLKLDPPEGENDNDNKESSEEDKVQINLERKLSLWTDLQIAVNTLVDSTKARNQADAAAQGIKQVIEKKEGLFRKHMMGKRVNYAARSVISPDPYISTSQIGVPLKFAKTLTYPQPVTPWNVEEMRQLVINGPDIHPGANFVESEMGRLIDLSKRTPHQREAISKTLLTRSASAMGTNSQHRVKRVWRHMITGDVVLMNRQPTLHKPSMMAHVTRVLTNPAMQTIRMHYANCNTYNADFDGDEMNMHFPQNELARAEAYHIAANDHQYLVPTDGSPLRGLIQDHVDAGVKLTQRDTFLNKERYMQLLYNAWACMEDSTTGLGSAKAHIEIVPPAILKPEPLWTGKQVITSILKLLTKGLPPLNLNSKAKIKGELYGTDNAEHIVVFRDGELLQGILDKAQFGASMHGLVHACYEIYGARIAADLLTTLGRLFTCYLQFAGHTCALEDLTLSRDAEERRSVLVQNSVVEGEEAYAEYAGLHDLLEKKRSSEIKGKKRRMNDIERLQIRESMTRLLGDPDAEKGLDAHMMGTVHGSNSAIIKTCLPSGQTKSFPSNCFSLMVLTGAKGSMVNHSQISCGLGQQALEGRRVPRLCSGRSLPSFEPFDPAPRAGGYITDRFLTGLRPQEYYHHCMAGREGLVDTAVKTSRSGYLQRCLVKHLEDLQVGYDHTVRTSDGNVIQFLYGEDGIDPVSSAMLSGKDDQFMFQAMNHRSISHKYSLNAKFFEETKFDIMKPLKLHEERKKEIKRLKRAESGKLSKEIDFPIGLIVSARRLKTGERKWKWGNIEKGFVDAEIVRVIKQDEDGPTEYDIKYIDSGIKAYNVPVKAHFKPKSKSNKTRPMSGTVEILERKLVDPVMQSLPLNSHVGLISERIQDKLWDFTQRNPGNSLGLAKKIGKKLKKSKLKQVLTKGSDDHTDEIDFEKMQSTHVVSPDAFQLLVWVNYMRSMCAPGENVGVLAAQSIGEPSTQMTLNTFHLAGHGAANVTLGIPRLREIIMTASANMSTPMMTIPFRSDVDPGCSEAIAVEQALNQVTLDSLLHPTEGVHVKDEYVKGHNGIAWVREYTVRLKFVDQKKIFNHFGLTQKQVFDAVGGAPKNKGMNGFLRRLLFTISRQTKSSLGKGSLISKGGNTDYELELTTITKSKGKKGEDDDEVDEDEQGTLRFGTRNEVAGYGDMDDEDEAIRKAQDQEDEKKEKAMMSDSDDEDSANKTSQGSDDELRDDMSNGVDKEFTTKPFMSSGMEILEVPKSVEKNNAFVYCGKHNKKNVVEFRLRFPAHSKTLLMVPLVEKVAKQILVRHCPGISRCYRIQQRLENDQKESTCLQTVGLNFQAIWQFEHLLDVNRLATNDIYQVLRTYGVEAARASISKQIMDVFGVYGISVDPRHLSLLADYMTAQGGYMPLNRSGMEEKGSVFQQITFETSMKFLTQAALNNLHDELESPSARLVLGLPPRVGTGSFSLLQPLVM